MKNLGDYGIDYGSLRKIKRFETNFKRREGYYCVVKSSDKVIHKPSLFLGFEKSNVVARKSLVCQRTFGAGLMSHKLKITIKWENRENSQHNHFIRFILEKTFYFLFISFSSLLGHSLFQKLLHFLLISLMWLLIFNVTLYKYQLLAIKLMWLCP